MSTVDEILASGRYTDRRGRVWVKCPVHPVELNDCWWTYGRPIPGKYEHKPGPSMRLLIERDQHRSECPGLADCMTHPVLAVIVCYEHGEGWGLFKVGVRAQSLPTIRRTLPEAMDAARALAVAA